MKITSAATVILDRSETAEWILFRAEADRTETEAVDAPAAEAQAAFLDFTSKLCRENGFLTGIIVIERDAEDEPGVKFFLAGSIPVYLVPASLVVAEIESTSQRLVYIEAGCDLSATLLMRGESGLVTRVSKAMHFSNDGDADASLRRFVDVSRALGYERIAISQRWGNTSGESEEIAAQIESICRPTVITIRELHEAARTLINRKVGKRPGVCMDGEYPPALRMTVDRNYTFAIQHTTDPVFASGNVMLQRALGGRQCVIFIDEAVSRVYGEHVRRYADERLDCKAIVTVEGSEQSKTLDRLREVCEAAMRSGIRRDGVFVACGGGVVLDLIGTAASIYRRATSYFRIPTTLVGMIDVAVGIKQGLNFSGKKNFLGAFHAPLGGINDPRFLATVPRAAISAGIAEIIKVALLLDPGLFEILECFGAELLQRQFQHPLQIANEVLLRAEYTMMRELQPNLWETDLRRFVDFGHTFSTIIETDSEFEVTHGHAVALDMLVSTAIAVEVEVCRPTLLTRLINLYRLTELPLWHELLSISLLAALPSMRLHRAGNLNLVVPVELGRGTFLQDVDARTLHRALERIEMTMIDAVA